MKLGEIVLSAIRHKLPKGNIFRGKYRLVKKVTPLALAELRRDLQIEESNLFYLRHPYLTFEQSYGHSKELDKHTKWMNKWRKERREKFSKHRRLEDELTHLAVSENWDFKAGAK